ncbi:MULTISPECIES: hypothetical protein [Mycolicibacter]|uniref:Uncharacterized protein n=2 Tax=Mycolicibacter TaxID=1073531 RepID=A0ABU5XKZ7_9MYCO|nr:MULTISPECIES: hypothetical protein [unclassified Mycolicibacter]MEB3022971.1 hypothetical protein [Mycolicibacter sp. MYC098]MEB3033481.1 hypothetical protein [Mycolicibacter sp. MYC340]
MGTGTRDYLQLDTALAAASARLSASPPTAITGAHQAITELWREQDGDITANQLAAICQAAHSAATANGAHFDQAAQRYLACCERCAVGASS